MRSRWLIGTIVIIFLIMIVAAFVQQPKISPVKQNPPMVMKTYTDPAKVFSVSVPSTWSTTPSTATSTTGLKTAHPVTQTMQITQFTKPAEMGLTVQVLSGKPTCPLQEKLTTTVAGLPAAFNPAISTYTIPTQTATILVSFAYPGTNSFHGPLQASQPTPFPQATVAADKQLVFAMLKTLTFPNLKSFSCN
jgi:hypothetical protein